MVKEKVNKVNLMLNKICNLQFVILNLFQNLNSMLNSYNPCLKILNKLKNYVSFCSGHYTGEEISFKNMLAFAKTVSLKATGSSIVKSNLFIIFGSKRGVGMFVCTNLSAQ